MDSATLRWTSMSKSFSIGRLTATQSSLEQAFHAHLAQPTPPASAVRELTVLAHTRSASASAGNPLTRYKPYSGRPLCVAVKRCAQLNLHTLSRRKLALSN